MHSKRISKGPGFGKRIGQQRPEKGGVAEVDFGRREGESRAAGTGRYKGEKCLDFINFPVY